MLPVSSDSSIMHETNRLKLQMVEREMTEKSTHRLEKLGS